jgi:hypothetical protein
MVTFLKTLKSIHWFFSQNRPNSLIHDVLNFLLKIHPVDKIRRIITYPYCYMLG